MTPKRKFEGGSGGARKATPLDDRLEQHRDTRRNSAAHRSPTDRQGDRREDILASQAATAVKIQTWAAMSCCATPPPCDDEQEQPKTAGKQAAGAGKHFCIHRGPTTNLEPETPSSLSQTAAPALADKPLQKAMSESSAEMPLASLVQTKNTPSNMRLTYDLLEEFDDDVRSKHFARTVGNLLPGKMISCVGTERKKRMLSMTAVARRSADKTVVQTVPRSEQLLFLFLVLVLEGDDTVSKWIKAHTGLDLDYDAAFGADLASRKLSAAQLLVHSKAAFMFLFGYSKAVVEKSVTKSLATDLKTEVTRGDMEAEAAAAIQASSTEIIAELVAIDGLLENGGGKKWRPLKLQETSVFLQDCLGVTAETPHYCPTRFLRDRLLKPCTFDAVWGMPDDKSSFTAVTFPIGGVLQIGHLKIQSYYENCVFVGDAQIRTITPLIVYGMANLSAEKIGNNGPLSFCQKMMQERYSTLYPTATVDFSTMAPEEFLKMFTDNVGGKTRFMGGIDLKGSFGADVLATCQLAVTDVIGEPKQSPGSSCVVFSDQYDEGKGEFFVDGRTGVSAEAKLKAQSSRGKAMLPVIQLISQPYKTELTKLATGDDVAAPEPAAEDGAAGETEITVTTKMSGTVAFTEIRVPASVDHATASERVAAEISAIAEDGKRAENSLIFVTGENYEVTALLPDYPLQTASSTQNSFELCLQKMWLQQTTTEATHDAFENDFDDTGAQEIDLRAMAVTSHGTRFPPKVGSDGSFVSCNVAWRTYVDNDVNGTTTRAVTEYRSDRVNSQPGCPRSNIIISYHAKWDADRRAAYNATKAAETEDPGDVVCPPEVFVREMFTQLATDAGIHLSTWGEPGDVPQTDASQKWVAGLEAQFQSFLKL